jgi:hypothetical protein
MAEPAIISGARLPAASDSDSGTQASSGASPSSTGTFSGWIA